ncbi:hypothetical protein XENOCAPTIV_018786, partial [Xenoophorus captivus]
VRFQYALETVSGFILPYAIIITCYVLILRRLRQTRFQRRLRSEILILAIVVTFGIFWFPYHIINMVQVSKSLLAYNHSHETSTPFCSWVLVLITSLLCHQGCC